MTKRNRNDRHSDRYMKLMVEFRDILKGYPGGLRVIVVANTVHFLMDRFFPGGAQTLLDAFFEGHIELFRADKPFDSILLGRAVDLLDLPDPSFQIPNIEVLHTRLTKLTQKLADAAHAHARTMEPIEAVRIFLYTISISVGPYMFPTLASHIMAKFPGPTPQYLIDEEQRIGKLAGVEPDDTRHQHYAPLMDEFADILKGYPGGLRVPVIAQAIHFLMSSLFPHRAQPILNGFFENHMKRFSANEPCVTHLLGERDAFMDLHDPEKPIPNGAELCARLAILAQKLTVALQAQARTMGDLEAIKIFLSAIAAGVGPFMFSTLASHTMARFPGPTPQYLLDEAQRIHRLAGYGPDDEVIPFY